ncbi:MAG: Nramp family divalent metal transporter [Phycisphaerae bacterium]|nr:Nramp family divalent metal transporter [Phycisphaerae bacterium]
MPDSHPTTLSLSEVHGSVATSGQKGLFRRMLAFAGPAYLISVGYMDPGNWATDLEGGGRFGYSLVWVLLMSNLMAVLLQTMAARLGVVTGRDLAQACRDNYNRGASIVLWVLCEIAIAATDLAELLGTTIGLNLLFGLPLQIGVAVTAFDTLLLLWLQRLGIRKIEAFILALVVTIALCFVFELFLAKPDWAGVAGGFVPRFESPAALYVAIGMLGATVMPHNLYLHSALVQTRQFGIDEAGKKRACWYNFIDSAVALNGAFFVNAAILILAAATFCSRGIEVQEIQQASNMLHGLLGNRLAPIAFGLALVCAGQSSTLTGTLAGQVVMEGFVHLRVRPWVRRLVTRSLAIIPAAIVIWISGSHGTYRLLILSQVILSLQLPFAIVPLLQFTSSRRAMGAFANPAWVKVLAWLVAGVIVALNVALVIGQLGEWAASPGLRPWVLFLMTPVVAAMGAFLAWLTFGPVVARWRVRPAPPAMAVAPTLPVEASAPVQVLAQPLYARIAVALDNSGADANVLRHAIPLARSHNAAVLLLHVVESPTADVYGAMVYDTEDRRDHQYMDNLATQIHNLGLNVEVHIGHGRASEEIVGILAANKADLLVVGSHGHRRLLDLLLGETVSAVRHGLDIPVLAVK